MSKHEELFKLIKENPELPIVPMVFWEVCADDRGYWLGELGMCGIDEYIIFEKYGKKRYCFKSDDFEYLVDYYIENHDWELEDDLENKDDEIQKEQLAMKIVDNLKWVKCIYVRIELPIESEAAE